jgi:hypothetical protein
VRGKELSKAMKTMAIEDIMPREEEDDEGPLISIQANPSTSTTNDQDQQEGNSSNNTEAKLKEPIPTSFSTCELHAFKNLELAHYVDRLQDENDELRKLMGWLSGHEPQLRIMIETYKRQDGEGLGANKVGEGSGENIPEPPKTHHKNDFPPKPNHLRN